MALPVSPPPGAACPPIWTAPWTHLRDAVAVFAERRISARLAAGSPSMIRAASPGGASKIPDTGPLAVIGNRAHNRQHAIGAQPVVAAAAFTDDRACIRVGIPGCSAQQHQRVGPCPGAHFAHELIGNDRHATSMPGRGAAAARAPRRRRGSPRPCNRRSCVARRRSGWDWRVRRPWCRPRTGWRARPRS